MKSTVIAFTSFCLAATLNGQVSWQFTNGPHYANIDDFAIGESEGQVILYAADSAYVEVVGEAFVLKSTDRGKTWAHMNIEVLEGPVMGTAKCVATFSSNTDIVYAGVFGAGIYKSTDGGDSWITTDEPDNLSLSRIAIHPTNSSIVWAGCQRQAGGEAVLYSSVDGGANWDPRLIGAPNPGVLSVSDIALVQNSDYVWVSTYSGTNNTGIWRTVNGGGLWEPKNTGISSSNPHLASLVVDPGNPDILYTGNSRTGSTTYTIYKTTSGTGACTWASEILPVSGSIDFSDIRISSQGVVYATASGLGVLKYGDGAEEWVTLADDLLFNDFKAIEIDPLNESIVYAGTSESHYKSSDGGATWHERNQGALFPSVTYVASNNGRLLSTGYPEHIFRKEEGSSSWSLIFHPNVRNYVDNNMATAIAIDPVSEDNALFGWEDEDFDDLHIWRTTDGGLSWNESMVEGPKLLTDIAYDGQGSVFVSTYHPSPQPDGSWVLRSTDGGGGWEVFDVATVDGAELWSITMSGNNIYLGGKESNACVYRSTNEGSTWTKLSAGLPSATGSLIWSLSADQTDENVVYAGTTGGVYKSVDGGTTWDPTDVTGVSIRSVLVHSTNPSVIYAVSDDAEDPLFFRSTDRGENWENMSDDFPNVKAYNLELDPTKLNVIYAGTDGGVYSLPHVWTGTLANTTWISGETHLVEGTLTVPQGVELVIEPGAEVRFSSGAKLDVKGTLEVNGTSSSLVTFTRDGTSGSWMGIVAENSAASPTVDLNYARIEYSSTGIRVGNRKLVTIK